jgi:hypothetical protein
MVIHDHERLLHPAIMQRACGRRPPG